MPSSPSCGGRLFGVGKIALVLIVVVAAVLLYVLIGSDVGSNNYDPLTDGENELDENERAMLEGTGRGGRNNIGPRDNGDTRPNCVSSGSNRMCRASRT